MNKITAEDHSVTSHRNLIRVIGLLVTHPTGLTIKETSSLAQIGYSQARGILASALLEGWVVCRPTRAGASFQVSTDFAALGFQVLNTISKTIGSQLQAAKHLLSHVDAISHSLNQGK